jgi:hypothetical protein
MENDVKKTPPRAEWTDAQMREALRIVLRHATGAPEVHFGDRRERSSFIRAQVCRVQHTARLRAELGAVTYLCENMRLSREEKTQLFDISHALRGEIAERRQKAGE